MAPRTVCEICLDGVFEQRRQLPVMDDLLRFTAVTQLGSFSRAARELGLTRGTMTQSMNRLETTLGATLFHRARHGREVTRMTTAGSRLYPGASSIIATATLMLPDSFGGDR